MQPLSTPFPCHRAILFGILSLAMFAAASAEPLATIDVPAAKQTLQIARDVSSLAGKQVGGVVSEGSHLEGQIEPALTDDGQPDERARRLVIAVPPSDAGKGTRTITFERMGQGKPTFRIEPVGDTGLTISDRGASVLTYNFGTITKNEIPEKEHRRSRACYVHPVWGLNGEVLTDDFPKDHYHHHGVFWTWPHVGIGEKQHDLWAGNTIRQKFERWLHKQAGPVAATLAVENGWYVGDEKVMIERVWIRAFRQADDARAIDFELTFIPVGKPITLWGAEGKSYGGLTVRFKPGPKDDTSITVPDGKTRGDLPDTPLKWADFSSKFDKHDGISGAALFVPPSHPDFPPTWLTRHYGPLCVGWPGVKPKTFEPGKPFRLSYRLWIHKNAVTVDDLKQAYEGYTAAEK